MSSDDQGEGLWIVPITLCFGSYDVRKNFLLQTESATLDAKEFLGSQIAKGNDVNSWVKLNVDRAGYKTGWLQHWLNIEKLPMDSFVDDYCKLC